MLPRHVIPALCGLLPLAAASPAGRGDDAPGPWQITSLYTFSPSGRPGSSPHSIVNITITDPNSIPVGSPTAATPSGAIPGVVYLPPSTAVCGAAFVADGDGDGDGAPWNQIFNCSSTNSSDRWTFELWKPRNGALPSATTNFDVSFLRASYVVDDAGRGERYGRKFAGAAHFEAGKNLAGLCGASGVCSWGLKEEERPYLVRQSELVS